MMSQLSRRAAASFFVCLMLLAAGCGSSNSSSGSSTSTTSSSSGEKPTGSLTVYAASSVTKAFTDYKATLEAENSGLSITNNFAGSAILVTQLENGAPADLFASADEKNMNKVVAKGLVETPTVFARNKLQIAVAPGNPKQINGLADLQKSGVTLVLCDPSVPAGNYARQAFEKAGLPAPQPASNELDVKSALQKVINGDADATIVYVTDVTAAGNKVTGVTIPDDQNVLATYPIAILKASKNQTAAQEYINGLLGGAGREALKSAGFLPPS
jgi:molybdate transport system substrate-binding protein